MTAQVSISKFARRQTKSSPYSYFDGEDSDLISRVEENIANAEQGYRDGVLKVSVDPEGFYSSTITLRKGDTLEGRFEQRVEGEKPRKRVSSTKGSKTPAKSVEVILYHHDVLSETNSFSTLSTWEIVSINASVTTAAEPISVDALIANHLGLSGGTKTNMSDEEFVKALRKSVEYWADKATYDENSLTRKLEAENAKLKDRIGTVEQSLFADSSR